MTSQCHGYITQFNVFRSFMLLTVYEFDILFKVISRYRILKGIYNYLHPVCKITHLLYTILITSAVCPH